MRPTLGADVEAAAAAVWDELVELDRWPHWGPTVRSAHLDGEARRLHPGATGTVETVVGLRLRFHVDDWSEDPSRRSWSWRVAGVPATRHTVTVLGPSRCRVEMSVPLWAIAYLGVVAIALRRIQDRAQG